MYDCRTTNVGGSRVPTPGWFYYCFDEQGTKGGDLPQCWAVGKPWQRAVDTETLESSDTQRNRGRNCICFAQDELMMSFPLRIYGTQGCMYSTRQEPYLEILTDVSRPYYEYYYIVLLQP